MDEDPGFPWGGLAISILIIVGFVLIALLNGTGHCT